MIRCILALLALTACGPRPDYVSQHGASYYFQGRHWQPEQIEAQEGSFVEHVPAPWLSRQAARALGRTNVYLMAPGFDCRTGDWFTHCEGLEIDAMVEVADFGCPFNSALIHEVAHVMQSSAGVYDPNHTDLELWRVANSAAGECEP